MVNMEKNIRFLIVLLCGALSLGIHAQEKHWSCDAYAYQYDMTAYVALVIDGVTVNDYSDYEIAAFCDDECRGIAEIQTVGSGNFETTYGYLRIRSNHPSGEIISFKVYKKSTAKEMKIHNTSIAFQSQQLVGLPSSPLVLNMIEKGDANGDGVINIADVTAIINHINGSTPDSFVLSAADANGDGSINIADVTAVINIINQ